jgi:hypothetical protein
MTGLVTAQARSKCWVLPVLLAVTGCQCEDWLAHKRDDRAPPQIQLTATYSTPATTSMTQPQRAPAPTSVVPRLPQVPKPQAAIVPPPVAVAAMPPPPRAHPPPPPNAPPPAPPPPHSAAQVLDASRSDAAPAGRRSTDPGSRACTFRNRGARAGGSRVGGGVLESRLAAGHPHSPRSGEAGSPDTPEHRGMQHIPP